MEAKELNKTLRDQARKLGLCDQWYKEWDKESTRQELIEKYLRGIDFCIEHDYPNVLFIKSVFPKKQLMNNGIFLDDNIDLKNMPTAVLLGNTVGKIAYDGIKTGNIYLRHDSSLKIAVSQGAKVFVEIYENAKLEIECDEQSKAFVYQHGGSVKTAGKVVLRDKRKAGV